MPRSTQEIIDALRKEIAGNNSYSLDTVKKLVHELTQLQTVKFNPLLVKIKLYEGNTKTVPYALAEIQQQWNKAHFYSDVTYPLRDGDGDVIGNWWFGWVNS